MPETIHVPILLNRERELRMFTDMIKKTGKNQNLIISADRNSGKSHLLKGFVRIAVHNNYKCVLVSQADFNVSMAYFTIQQVFKEVSIFDTNVIILACLLDILFYLHMCTAYFKIL